MLEDTASGGVGYGITPSQKQNKRADAVCAKHSNFH